MNIIPFFHFTALTELFTTLSMAFGEVLSIAVIFTLINSFAKLIEVATVGTLKAIKITYVLGLWAGWFYKKYLTPAILYSADKLTEFNSYIDWQQVGSDFKNYFAIATAGVVTSAEYVYGYTINKLTTQEYALKVYNTPLTTGLA